MSYREVNLGNIFNGKSSYELAVEHEKFIGTEEQYVDKEQKAYDDIVEYGENLKAELASISMIPAKIVNRMNNLGTLANELLLDTVYDNNKSSHVIDYNEDDSITYVCNYKTAMYIGYETDIDGVQLKLDFLTGLSIRRKCETNWTDWSTFVTATDKEV